MIWPWADPASHMTSYCFCRVDQTSIWRMALTLWMLWCWCSIAGCINLIPLMVYLIWNSTCLAIQIIWKSKSTWIFVSLIYFSLPGKTGKMHSLTQCWSLWFMWIFMFMIFHFCYHNAKMFIMFFFLIFKELKGEYLQ